MSPIQNFWGERRWGLRFGAWGEPYTIALAPRGGGYHIGLDIPARDGEDVPALLPGRVVAVVNTDSMGRVVVVDVGGGRWIMYAHLADDRLPRVGAWLNAGDRVGRPANGPKKLPKSHPEFPGSAWNGRHIHTVVSRHPRSGYEKIPGHRTLSAFIDPTIIIRGVLSGAASYQEEDMSQQDIDRMQKALGNIEDKINALSSELGRVKEMARFAAQGKGGVQVVKRVQPGFDPEWMLIDPTLPPHPDNPRVDGFRVTTDIATARVWLRVVSGEGTVSANVDRDSYIALQGYAASRARELRAWAGR